MVSGLRARRDAVRPGLEITVGEHGAGEKVLSNTRVESELEAEDNPGQRAKLFSLQKTL